MAYLFFLLFAPTLIPEAFQIKTVCSKKNHYQSLKKRKSWVSMIKITKYFLLISHTLERNNKPSHSNQFYCKKKNYYCIEKKIKILPFLQWIVIKCAKPLHPKSLLCPPNVFCSKTPPAFSRVSTVFNNSWNYSAKTAYDQHFWLRTTRVYHQNQKSKVPTTIISFSLTILWSTKKRWKMPSFFLREWMN